MARIVTFGELMLRLQPFNYERFVQASNVEFTFGGGEANVSVSLANYGMAAAGAVAPQIGNMMNAFQTASTSQDAPAASGWDCPECGHKKGE